MNEIRTRLLTFGLLVFVITAGWQWLRAEESTMAHAKTVAEFAEYRATQAKEHTQALEKVRVDEAHIRKIQQEALNAEYLARIAAEADADSARNAAGGLRQRAAQLAAAARCSAGDSALAASGPPADAPGDLLAELLERVDQAAGEIGRYADQARRSGQLCERSYDALTAEAQ